MKFKMWIASLAVGLLLLIGIPVFLQYREESLRQQCKNHVRQIAIALNAYSDEFGQFPPAMTLGPDGKPWHSWRVLVLPYLGESDLYGQYRFDEPWNGPSNLAIVEKMPGILRCPSASETIGCTSYVAVVGRNTMWPAWQTVSPTKITDGTSNTLLVAEARDLNIPWTEPRDIGPVKLWDRFQSATTNHKGGTIAGFADAAPRFLSNRIDRSIFASLLTPSYGTVTFDGAWPELLQEAGSRFSDNAIRDVVSFPSTRLTPLCDEPLGEHENVLWCATFQLAWDEFNRQVPGAPVRLARAQAVADRLNAAKFDRSSLSDHSHLTVAAGVNPQATEQFRELVRLKYPGLEPAIEPVLTEQPGIRLYSYLQKHMPFKAAMTRFEERLAFRQSDGTTKRVTAFGILPGHDESYVAGSAAMSLVELLDYRSDDDFIVRIATDSPDHDEIILASITPDDSLESTWAAVQERERSRSSLAGNMSLGNRDELRVPMLDFRLRGRFEELEDVEVLNYPFENRLKMARQDLMLRLSETGADFVSEAEIQVLGENGHGYEPPPLPRILRLDQPFLIAFRERDAPEPYFLAWIATTSLMVVEGGG